MLHKQEVILRKEQTSQWSCLLCENARDHLPEVINHARKGTVGDTTT